jgi:hypothetical protein
MASNQNSPVSSRIRRELIEAAVEQAFGLVDLAEEAALRGNSQTATRILADAERVYLDIEERLSRLDAREIGPFLPLVAELRNSIDKARRRCA